MKKTRFTEAQIVSTLKKQETGIPTKEICRYLGISEATSNPIGRSKTTKGSHNLSVPEFMIFLDRTKDEFEVVLQMYY